MIKIYILLACTLIMWQSAGIVIYNPPLRLHLPKSTNFHIIHGDSSVGAKVFGDSVCIVEISAYETHRVKGVPQKMWLVDFHGGKYYVLDRDVQKSFTKGEKPEPKKKKTKQTRNDAVQCTGITKSGKQCTRMTTNASGKCWQHGG